MTMTYADIKNGEPKKMMGQNLYDYHMTGRSKLSPDHFRPFGSSFVPNTSSPAASPENLDLKMMHSP